MTEGIMVPSLTQLQILPISALYRVELGPPLIRNWISNGKVSMTIPSTPISTRFVSLSQRMQNSEERSISDSLGPIRAV